MVKLNEKQQKIHKLIKKWLDSEKYIRELKANIGAYKDMLYKLDPNLQYQYSPQVYVYKDYEKKTEIDNECIIDLIGIHPKYKHIISSSAFKIGALKKLEEMSEYYETIKLETIKIEKVNPMFMDGKDD